MILKVEKGNTEGGLYILAVCLGTLTELWHKRVEPNWRAHWEDETEAQDCCSRWNCRASYWEGGSCAEMHQNAAQDTSES